MECGRGESEGEKWSVGEGVSPLYSTTNRNSPPYNFLQTSIPLPSLNTHTHTHTHSPILLLGVSMLQSFSLAFHNPFGFIPEVKVAASKCCTYPQSLLQIHQALYSTVQYSIVQYSTLQYIIVQYSIVQYSIV